MAKKKTYGNGTYGTVAGYLEKRRDKVKNATATYKEDAPVSTSEIYDQWKSRRKEQLAKEKREGIMSEAVDQLKGRMNLERDLGRAPHTMFSDYLLPLAERAKEQANTPREPYKPTQKVSAKAMEGIKNTVPSGQINNLTPEEAVAQRSNGKFDNSDTHNMLRAIAKGLNPNNRNSLGAEIGYAMRQPSDDPYGEKSLQPTDNAERRIRYAKAARNDPKNPLQRALKEASRYQNGLSVPEAIRQYTSMSPMAKQRYNELYGEYGVERAEDFRAAISNSTNYRIAKQNYDENEALHNPVSRTGSQFLRGVERFGEGMDNTVPFALGIAGKKPTSVSTYESGIMRNKAGGAEGVAQDIASTSGFMAPSALLGAGLGAAGVASGGSIANALFGLSAGGNTYQEAINEGYSKSQATALGAQQTVDEFATEQLLGGISAFGGGSLRKLLGNTKVASAAREGIMKAMNTPLKQAAAGYVLERLSDMGGEAMQEFVQNYTEKIARNIILGENNEITLSDPEAWYSAALGALNAGLMNASTDVINTTANAQRLSEIVPTTERERQMYGEISDASEDGTLLGQLSDMYADKIDRGGKTNVLERGIFANAMDQAAEGATYDENYNDDEKVVEPEDTVTDISGTETQVSTQEQIKETVTTAVNAIKEEQSNDVADTSESTPEEAKNLTQQAFEAIRAEEAVHAEAESEKITTENTTESASQSPTNSKTVDEIKNIIDKNDYEVYGIRIDPREFSEGDILPRSHEWLQDDPDGRGVEDPSFNAEYGLWDNGELEGTSVLKVNADNLEDAISELKKLKYNNGENIYLVAGDSASAGMDPGELIIDNAVNLGKIDNQSKDSVETKAEYKDSVSETTENKKSVNVPRENAKADKKASAVLRTNLNVPEGVREKSDRRFSSDADAKSVYESGFEKFYDYFDADVVSNSLDIVERAYDENMAKAYDLGLQGKSLLSAAKDEAFNNFNTKFGDLTEQMWQAGYNRRAESNRAKSEKVASERIKTGEASVTETDRNSKINDELRLMARGKASENKTAKKTDSKGNFSDDNRRQKFEESLHKEDFETTKNEGSDAEVRPLDDILGDYAHRFGFNYTSGSRYVKGNKEGQYNLRDKGIRTKVTNALPAFSHEFGHWLADKYNIESTNKDLPKEVRLEAEKAFDKNLDRKNYKPEDITDEGIAEFIRYFCTNKDTARIDYPKLSDYILTSLSPKDLADFQAMADSINAVLAAGSEDMTQHTVLHEDRNPDFRTKGEILKDKWNHAYQLWADSNHSLRLLDRKYGSDTHTYAANAEYADSRIEYALADSLYDFDGNYLSPGLKPILSPINVNDKKEYEAFGDYLVLSHAPERLALGKRTFADDRQNNEIWMRKQADKILEKYPHFKGVAEQLYRFQDKVLLHYGVEQGLISRDAYKAMKKDYKRYVPFFRAGFSTNGDARKTAKGSGRTIINPVDNIITSTTKMMKAGMRNAIMLNVRNAAINNNYDAMFMEHIPDPKVPVTYDVKKMKDDLLDNAAYALNGYEAAPEAMDILQDVFDQVDDTLVQFKTGRANKSRNEISIMVDGKPEFWKINDPLLMDTLSSMDYRGSNVVLDWYGKVTRFMTNNLTGGNVKWSIFSNAPRDFQTYMYFTDNKNPASAVGNIFDSWKNSWNDAWGQPVDDYYREFMGMGAGGAPVWAGDENYVKEIRKNLSNKKNFNPLAPLHFLSDTIELGPRYATYKFCRERGMTPQQAFYASMEVTTNFRRHGIYSKEANKVFQFFNANLQGIDHALRYYMAEDLKGEFKNLSKEEAAKRRGKAIMGRVSFMVAASLIGSALNYLINHRSKEDKDEYRKLSNYLKNTNFTFSLGDGKFFSIPKGHELLVLESFFERALEYFFDKNDDALNKYYDYLTDNIAPPIVSDMLKFPVTAVKEGVTPATEDLFIGALSGSGILGVIAQEVANKNFMGNPIVYKNPYSKAPAKSEYNAKTSELAYLIGQAFNGSPQHIDHFCENVLGWIWETQEALNPIDDKKGTKGKRDYSIGVYNTYFRDNLYSNDISNWIYDKADKSEERYNEAGDNLLEMALDKKMKTYYANFSKASKMDINTPDGRAAKRGVLDELIAYKKGKASPEEKKVYDLVEKTGDESYLPDALNNTFKNGDENVSLNGKEYVRYQKSFNDIYYSLIGESLDPDEDVDKQKYAASQAEDVAKQLAMDEILKAKGSEISKPSKKLQYMSAEGADFDAMVEAMYKIKDLPSGSQAEKGTIIRNAVSSDSARRALWNIANSKFSEKSYTENVLKKKYKK